MALILPVNLTETYQQHFDTPGWASPQAQVDAGHPAFMGPGLASGSYTEVIDYGTLLASTRISVSYQLAAVQGAPSVVCQISTKVLAGDAWTDLPTGLSGIGTSFRYVRVFLTVTGGICTLDQLRFVLDSKLQTDNGAVSAQAADVGGTVVTFNRQFVDVQSITLTAAGTEPLTCVYDFVDAPNPTSFKVLVFNAAGARVNATVSWTARGI